MLRQPSFVSLRGLDYILENIMSEKLTMMAIYAHPDDEAFGTGGTLAKYAHEGVDVHLVTATLGEAGQVAQPTLKLTRPLSMLREEELRRACQTYGNINLHLLGYVDGQTAIVPISIAVYKLVKLIRQHQPQVVIGFGPDGIYGHFDHLVLHRWTTAAVEIAAHEGKWVDAGAAHQVAKFYHRVIPNEQVARMKTLMGSNSLTMDGGVPFPFVGYSSEQITTTINVRDYAQTKLDGIRCHASQLSPNMPYTQPDYDHSQDPDFNAESFILVQSTVNTDKPEVDLFAGLR